MCAQSIDVPFILGVSAGLACFSFLWHIFIHFFYLVRRFNEDYKLNTHAPTRSTTHIIDNLSSSLNSNSQIFLALPSTNNDIGSNEIAVAPLQYGLASGIDASNLPDNLKTFEKPSFKTDMKNFVESKRHTAGKNVEKTKIFGFNKRQPIYEQEEFDMMCETSNFSTIFFEVNDTSYMTSSKLENSRHQNTSSDQQHRGLNRDLCKSMDDIQQSSSTTRKQQHRFGKMSSSSIDNLKQPMTAPESFGDSSNGLDSMQHISDSRNSLLKRKGICSSQEMIHLVDIMSDNLSAEQVDVLARSLIELGGADSLRMEAEQRLQDLDRVSLLERLPEIIDDKLLENIDAAIYENQIIFQERIRKNQLTIQNLKLQDQLLSKYIEDIKLLPGNNQMNLGDYENVCFESGGHAGTGNIGLVGRLPHKHDRSYSQDAQTDDSTNQNSGFYMNTNTMSSSFTDLYIHENDMSGSTSAININESFADNNISTLANGTNNSYMVHYECDGSGSANDNYCVEW